MLGFNFLVSTQLSPVSEIFEYLKNSLMCKKSKANKALVKEMQHKRFKPVLFLSAAFIDFLFQNHYFSFPF